MALRVFRQSLLTRLMAIRSFSQNPTPSAPEAAKQPQKPTEPKVTGLSEKVVLKPKAGEKFGPGAAHDADYKVPEYFLYGRHSYYEAEIEMANFRCPQPSAVK